MSKTRDQLKVLGAMVHQGIQAYANIHRYIEKQGATAKSALKNLFGRGVPMSQLLEAAETLEPIWAEIQSSLIEFENQDRLLLDRDEQRYFDLLKEYVKRVELAIDALIERQRLLAHPPVKWDSHQSASQKYSAAMNAFMAVEEQMNQASLWR